MQRIKAGDRTVFFDAQVNLTAFGVGQTNCCRHQIAIRQALLIALEFDGEGFVCEITNKKRGDFSATLLPNCSFFCLTLRLNFDKLFLQLNRFGAGFDALQ